MRSKPRATKRLVATVKICLRFSRISVTVWLLVHRQQDICSVCCLQRLIECESGAYHAKPGFARHSVNASSQANLQKRKNESFPYHYQGRSHDSVNGGAQLHS